MKYRVTIKYEILNKKGEAINQREFVKVMTERFFLKLLGLWDYIKEV